MNIRLSHLALLLATTILFVGIGGIAATWRAAESEFRDVLKEDLEQQAELLAELLTESAVQLSDAQIKKLLVDVFDDDDEETLWVSVYDLSDGRLQSNLDHAQPLESDDDDSIKRQYGGFAWHGIQEREGGIVVQLLRRDDVYADIQEEILEDIVTPALIGSGITLLLLIVLIALTLGPLSRLVRELDVRNADSLAPLTTKTTAREIQVLRDSINSLMHGIDIIVKREREFASDVAHELRTPLTTLMLELGDDDPDMDAIRHEVERLVRIVEQLLTLARLEQGQWQQRFDSVPLFDLYTRVIEQFHDRFRLAGMSLESHLSSVQVAGDSTLLEILLKNLLQNVLQHCPVGTHASVTLEQNKESTSLRVEDDGPGITDDMLQQMSLGLTRLDSRSEGFGLGLAICHRIVAAHRGEIRFSAANANARGFAIHVGIPA